MPFKSNSDLPDRVKDNLPEHGQDIYRAAFNSAYDEYKDKEDRKGGRTAHAVAWAAVEHKYRKGKDGKWISKDE
jgi:cation transport regulator